MNAPKKATRFDAMMRWMEHQWFPDAREWVCSRAVGETLEIAIGTGLNLRYYPDTVEITAIDQDRDMMVLAEERAQATGLALHAEVGDALALPFVDDAFDTVVCTFALCEVSDVDVALQEFVRVLRPSGRLLLADHIVATSRWVRGGQRVLEALTIPISGSISRGARWTISPASVLRSWSRPGAPMAPWNTFTRLTRGSPAAGDLSVACWELRRLDGQHGAHDRFQFGADPVVDPGSGALTIDEAGFPQHFEMVTDGRPG